MLKEKWTSIIHHVKNRHEWDANKKFFKCAHEPLTSDDERNKQWLREGSPAYKALQSVVFDKRLLTDFAHLTKFSHTGNLEVYHAIVNKYCPKRQHFSYQGMICRTQLAALDHNSGAFCKQARTKKGLLRYYLAFPKQGKSWVAKPIKCHKTNSTLMRWLTELLNVVTKT